MKENIYSINNQEFRFPTPWWAWVVVLFIAPFSLIVAGAWCLDVQREVSK